MSDASPDSSSARTVEDMCLPMLSAAKNMYRGFINSEALENFATGSLLLAIWLMTLVSIRFLLY
jgi:hypothetical protein